MASAIFANLLKADDMQHRAFDERRTIAAAWCRKSYSKRRQTVFGAATAQQPRVPLIITAAIAIAVLIVLVLWSRQPDYKVLYANLTDRDGGAIITSLQQMNVPVQVLRQRRRNFGSLDHGERCAAAPRAAGLPKGGSVGFELMDGQKFGISEFAEQINYQRALEGELERTLSSIGAVQAARVHLAIPKPSVFVREQRSPSASVLVNLYPGRILDDGQVSAIAHMSHLACLICRARTSRSSTRPATCSPRPHPAGTSTPPSSRTSSRSNTIRSNGCRPS